MNDEQALEPLQRSLVFEQLTQWQLTTVARGPEPARAGDTGIAHEGWSDRAGNPTGWHPKVGTLKPAHKGGGPAGSARRLGLVGSGACSKGSWAGFGTSFRVRNSTRAGGDCRPGNSRTWFPSN